jgi:hypothetical protein
VFLSFSQNGNPLDMPLLNTEESSIVRISGVEVDTLYVDSKGIDRTERLFVISTVTEPSFFMALQDIINENTCKVIYANGRLEWETTKLFRHLLDDKCQDRTQLVVDLGVRTVVIRGRMQ